MQNEYYEKIIEREEALIKEIETANACYDILKNAFLISYRTKAHYAVTKMFLEDKNDSEMTYLKAKYMYLAIDNIFSECERLAKRKHKAEKDLLELKNEKQKLKNS